MTAPQQAARARQQATIGRGLLGAGLPVLLIGALWGGDAFDQIGLPFVFVCLLVQLLWVAHGAPHDGRITLSRVVWRAATGALGIALVVFAVSLASGEDEPFALAAMSALFAWALTVPVAYFLPRLPISERMFTGFARAGGYVCLLAVVAAFGVEIWAFYKMDHAFPEWTKAITAERERIAARPPRPVIEGDPVDGNAADQYWHLLRSRASTFEALDNSFLFRMAAVPGSAGQVMAEETTRAKASAMLDQHRADVATLRDALRRQRCDWGWVFEKGPDQMETPSWIAARGLANLLILEGHEAASRGDAHVAAVRYLEAARFGSDIADEPLLIARLIGMAVVTQSLEAMGAFVTSDPGRELGLEWAEAALARLQPALPALTALSRESVVFGSLSSPAILREENSPWAAPFVVPLQAHALGVLQAYYREAEQAASLPDSAEAESRLQAIEARRFRNPLLTYWAPGLSGAYVSNIRMRARLALVLSAVRVERKRGQDRRYPDDLSGLMDGDPFAKPGTKLRWMVEPDGRAYKLWSVGEDHKGGDGVAGEELVLQR